MEYDNILLIIFASLSILIVLFILLFSLIASDNTLNGEINFCNSKGYDGYNFFGGAYSEYYGKVECVSYFKNESVGKVFNVKRNWIGKIKEVNNGLR